MTERKIPKIRFKGFNDDWEQRKLGELGKARSGIGFPDAEQGGKEGIPFFKVSDMNNVGNEHEMLSANNYVTRDQIARKGWKTIDEVPAIFFAKVGAAVLLNRKRLCCSPFLLDNNTMAYSMNKSMLDPYFAKTLFETIDLTSLVQVGALPSYNAGDVENIEVNIPILQEQKKIGAYFKSLDNLITLHQRELARLKVFKKSMLENCFPKNGETVPKVRFSGFTGDWEQRKVSEITKFHKQGFYTTEDYSSGKKYYLLRGTDLTDNKLILRDTPKINATEADYQAFKTQIGDFLIVRSGTVGTYGIVYDDIPAIFGSYLIDFRFDKEQVTNEFFGYFYQSDSFKDQLRQIIQQSANTNINAENIKSTWIKLPSLDEQREISNFFLSLDNLITLHQSKLEKLQKIKKSLLEQMFI